MDEDKLWRASISKNDEGSHQVGILRSRSGGVDETTVARTKPEVMSIGVELKYIQAPIIWNCKAFLKF